MYFDQINVNIRYFIYINFLHTYLHKYVRMQLCLWTYYITVWQIEGKKKINNK